MSEEDLEVLITLDDPEGAPEEDTFNHTSVEKILEDSQQRSSNPASMDMK